MNPSAAGRTVRLLFQPLAGSERVLAIIQNAERFFCLNLSSGRENLKSPADSGGRRRPISSKSVCRANLSAVHPASGFRKTAQEIPPRHLPGRDCSVSKKPFRHAAASFSALKSAEKLMIQNERHPSWVSFVTIFLPVAHIFRVDRQSETPPVPGTHQTLYRSAEGYASIWNIKSSSSSRVMPPNMAPRSTRSSTAATSSLRKAQPTSASDRGSSAQTDRKSP